MTGCYVTLVKKFMFPRTWEYIFRDLPPVRAGMLIQALYAFVHGEEDPEKQLPEELQDIFFPMAKELEASAERYCKKVHYKDHERKEA